jgi:hypothetical protein
MFIILSVVKVWTYVITSIVDCPIGISVCSPSWYWLYGKHMREKIITRDEVEGDNFVTECVNHPNTFIQGQYVFYYTECLLIQVCFWNVLFSSYRLWQKIISSNFVGFLYQCTEPGFSIFKCRKLFKCFRPRYTGQQRK